MTDNKSDEFKAAYSSGYGRYSNEKPDFDRCSKAVRYGGAWGGSKQCTRKNGHGPHGAYCKQHDPIAVRAKSAAESAKLRAKWAEDSRNREFETNCKDAVRQIAAGHNDPRGLCQGLIDALNGAAK